MGRTDSQAGGAAHRTRGLGSSAVGRLFLRHDRAAQGDRAWPRGSAGRDAEGRAPAPRHRSRRPLLLVHDHRLDHVERAGQRVARRRDRGAVRRPPGYARPRRAVALRRARRRDLLRRGRGVLRQLHQGGCAARAGRGPVVAAHARVDRFAAACGVVPLGLRAREARPLAGVDRRRHRPRRCVPHRSMPARCSAVRWGSRWRRGTTPAVP